MRTDVGYGPVNMHYLYYLKEDQGRYDMNFN